ncbi:hypothetical protein GCK32_004886 [Trichostrongylus colubriformis]|uniref:Uncharacterized protein n=1 Tax=Trichostrongylus colubriformis TaxID=6319 RepID=A0AAN8FSL4_TRICO
MKMDDATSKQEKAQLSTPARCSGCGGKAAQEVQLELQRLRINIEIMGALKRTMLLEESRHQSFKAQLKRQTDEMLELRNAIAQRNHILRQSLCARQAHLEAPVNLPEHASKPPAPRKREQ